VIGRVSVIVASKDVTKSVALEWLVKSRVLSLFWSVVLGTLVQVDGRTTAETMVMRESVALVFEDIVEDTSPVRDHLDTVSVELDDTVAEVIVYVTVSSVAG
jgi:hypothetical protein